MFRLFRQCRSQARHYSGTSTAYCRDLVKKHDYESWLLAPFYPKELRNGYFALKAFYIDLAMIQDTVSNSMIGHMRMQFWRDAIRATKNPPKHPIVSAVHEVLAQSRLPAYHFLRIIDARDAEIDSPTHLTMDSLTAHAEATSCSLLYLLLSYLGLSESHTLSHAASHLGVAQTCTTLLRALPFHAHNRRMVIPAEITAKNGVVQEEVFQNGGQAANISDAVFEFATLGNDHLLTARSMLKEGGEIPLNAMPIFLAGVPVSRFLQRIEENNFDAFDPRLQTKDWKLPWNVYLSYHQRKI